MVDVGVDLHKNYSQVAMLDAWGEIRQEHIEQQGKEMEEFVRRLEPGSRLAVEATGNWWWWFVDLVESQGHQVVMSNPKETKAIAHARLKNDRVDAEKLAILLRSGFLPQVWIAPAPIRYAKEVLRYRSLLVGMRTKLRNHLGAMLRKRNRQAPGQSLWGRKGRAYVESVALNPEADQMRGEALEQIKALDRLIGGWDQALGRRAKGDPLTRRLMSVPGVGVQTALAFQTFVGEVERFASAKKVASYFGLAPRERSSGNRRQLGHITKEGDSLMRHLLVEAALMATRRPGPLREFYRRLLRHKGKAKARVAVARKLTEILYQLWKQGCDYHAYLLRGLRTVGEPVIRTGL
jgi:transposase